MIDYVGIISDHKEMIPKEALPWMKYLYHFTDVHNIPGILRSGMILSRSDAKDQNLMQSDNASRSVIDITVGSHKRYARLYFRPKTPTQYHNEGYKPQAVRNSQIDASCPVPVFLLLDLNKTLNLEGASFAEKGIAGSRSEIRSGEDSFRKLHFEKIYHDGPYDKESEGDIKEYRLSEVVREYGFPIEGLLKGIMCRSEAERETLLQILNDDAPQSYEKYKRLVIYNPNVSLFFNNGIFVKKAYIDSEKRIVLELNEPRTRAGRGEEILVTVSASIEAYDDRGELLEIGGGKLEIDYSLAEVVRFSTEKWTYYKYIMLSVYFDGNEMYRGLLQAGGELI